MQVWAGVDAGKTGHHCVAIDADARVMHLAATATTETVFIAVYTPDRDHAAAFGGHILERALFLGIGLLASVHVTPDGWERLDRPGQSGTAEQVRDSIINAEMIARGSVVRDSVPADVPFTGAPDAAERIAAVAPKRPRAAVAWWHAVINADRALLPADAYQLAAALSHADEGRDRLIAATIGTGSEDVPELRDLLLGRPGTAPDWDRGEKAARTLTGALAHTPAGHRAGILTALGWLAWLQGRGTVARAWIARARDDEPRHRLALLLEQLIRREIAPVALDPTAAYRSDRA